MKGASDEMFGALIVGCSLGTYLLAYVLDKVLGKLDEHSWIPNFKRFGGLGSNIPSRRSSLSGAGFTKAGGDDLGASSGRELRGIDGAVAFEMGEIVRRSSESPGKGWLSGVTTARAAGSDGEGIRGGTGGLDTGLVRRSSGSVLV